MQVSNLKIKSDEERIVSGIIAEPLILDTDNEFYSRAGVLKMYHDFVANKLQKNIDREHNNILTGSEIIKTYIALENDPDNYPEGAWVGECKIASDSDWDAVKRGEINGFSVEISTIKVDVTIGTEQMLKASGMSEVSTDAVLPEHSHEVTVWFDALGRVIKSEVQESLGHTHTVSKCTATDMNIGHSHRILLERG